MAGPPQQRRRLQEETRLVLEAFLLGALGRRPPLGHVGGSYHDPHCYAHRRPVERGGAWTPLHEEISRAEERKHGFKTSMKRLLQRRTSPHRDPPGPPPPRAEPREGLKEGGEGRPKHGRGFSRLAEAYTARADPASPSPQLARLALTMELTRKVAGINSHTVQTLMGYSLQYMDMFVPWLQQQGGWESIAGQDEMFDILD
ncbi:secretory interleukin-1 receptor antagonist [Platysternon megacephalum]|uniref:Secretory interleukin-1 receptor antagonist n=1 Tax=Platysternon megacephalum TaxID=55544 RepID=A0A4D9DGI0_9SAUR|nr:secretory interleukin-1 receptor antagonist [Platysternon megacephalum]